jgi:hypothetical protein
MTDKHNSEAATLHTADHVVHSRFLPDSKSGRRLVEKKDLGRPVRGSRHSHALLLAA